MAQNKKKNGKKLDIRTIILILLAVALIVGIATGKISLSELLGGHVDMYTFEGETTAVETKAAQTTKAAAETKASESTAATKEASAQTPQKKEYKFRNKDRLDEHYEKHGIEMGFKDAEAYRKAASNIINAAGSQGVLYKYKSDGSGDMCFYVEATKEFVVLSNDGYIRTYYICSGISYYNRQ